MYQLKFRLVQHLKMTIWISVLWKMKIQLAKKCPEMGHLFCPIHFRSEFTCNVSTLFTIDWGKLCNIYFIYTYMHWYLTLTPSIVYPIWELICTDYGLRFCIVYNYKEESYIWLCGFGIFHKWHNVEFEIFLSILFP